MIGADVLGDVVAPETASSVRHSRAACRAVGANANLLAPLHRDEARNTGVHGSHAAAATLPGVDFDDALVVDGCRVLWTTSGGSLVRRRFTFDAPVLSAVWARFNLDTHVSRKHGSSGGGNGGDGDAGAMRTCLCVLYHPERIYVYSLSGATYTASLPCAAARIVALSEGVLVQRAAVATATYTPAGGSSSGARATAASFATPVAPSRLPSAPAAGADKPPLVFTLLHPIEELRPVAVVLPTARPGSLASFRAANLAYLDDEGEELVSVLTECSPQLLVTFNRNTQRHRLWQFLQRPGQPRRREPPKRVARGSRLSMVSEEGGSARRAPSPTLRSPSAASRSFVSHNPGDARGEPLSPAEDDHGLIMPEMYVRLVWADDASPRLMPSRADEVFTSSTTPRLEDTEDFLVCLACRSQRQVHALRVSRRSDASASALGSSLATQVDTSADLVAATHAHTQDALAATSVEVAGVDDEPGCGPPPAALCRARTQLMLLLGLDGVLRLHCGSMPVCRVTPIGAPHGRATCVADGVGPRATLTVAGDSGGTTSVRVSVSLRPASQLAHRCLQACEAVLSTKHGLLLRAHVVAMEYAQRKALADAPPANGSLDRASTLNSHSWASFVQALAAAAAMHESAVGALRISVAEAGAPRGDSAWEALLHSDFHAAFEEAEVCAGNGPTALGLAAVGGSDVSDGNGVAVDAGVVQALAPVTPGSATEALHRRATQELATRYREAVAEAMDQVLVALHCVYQDVRLGLGAGVQAELDGTRLAGLLAAVTSAVGDARYCEHYLRDWGCLAPGYHFQRTRRGVPMAPLPPPWDVMKWCGVCVRGDDPPQPPRVLLLASGTSAGAAFATAAGVVRAYACLTGAVYDGAGQDDTLNVSTGPGSGGGAMSLLRGRGPDGDVAMTPRVRILGSPEAAPSTGASARSGRSRRSVGIVGTGALAQAAAAVQGSVAGSPGSSLMEQSTMVSGDDQTRGERSMGNITLVSTGADDDVTSSRTARDRAAVLALVREDRRRAVPLLDSLPFAVALPLRDALHRCRPAPPAAWPRAAYDLIGRADLGTVRFGISRDTAPWRRIATEVGDRARGASAGAGAGAGAAQPKAQSKLRFGRDRRLAELCRLLCSSEPGRIRPPQLQVLADMDEVAAVQTRLKWLCARIAAAPVGRGAVTLGSLQPEVTDALRVPTLALAARAPPVNAVIGLDHAELPDDFDAWPQFHNATAASLRLRAGVTHLTRSWVRQHARGTPTAATAGLLFGFGLRGVLSSLRVGDVYSYLHHRHDLTNIAVLLGSAAAAAGTIDASLSKTLRLYLPSLIPGAAHDTVHVSLQVQSAVLVGVGLLYRGTAHRLMTEFLLREIGRRPAGDILLQEGYSLSAGLALGLVTLGRGGAGDVAGLGVADLRLQDRLYAYMNGSPPSMAMGQRRSTAAHRDLGTDELAGDRASDTHTIHHGVGINVSVTSAGATVALGLMFMNTGNDTAATALQLPDTIGELGGLAPEAVIMRVVCRGLVLPGYVEPTAEWLNAQIPKTVVTAMRHHAWAKGSSGSRHASATARWLGVEEEAPGGSTRFMASFHPLDQFTVRETFVTAVAGACMAIALRYAGTADKRARNLLLGKGRMLQAMRNAGVAQCYDVGCEVDAPPRSQVERVSASRGTLEMCCGVVALSLGVVMAGTGEVATMRFLRELRNKVDAYTTYGNHMAYSMAIGFLFLHGGTATFSRTPEALAALVCALHPRFPNSPTDGQYHLQALRHLYVLAVTHRYLSVRDIDSGEEVYCPLSLEHPADAGHAAGVPSKRALVAPCLLPQFRVGATLTLASPRYWSYTLVLDEETLRTLRRGFKQLGSPFHAAKRGAGAFPMATGARRGRHGEAAAGGLLLWVKRKSAHLSYLQDPHGRRSLSSRAFPDSDTSPDARAAFISAFTEDPTLHAFAQRLCSSGVADDAPSDSDSGSDSDADLGTPGSAPTSRDTYMAATAAVQRLGTSRHALPAANLALMFTYYTESAGGGSSQPTLLDDEFVTSTRHAVRSAAVAAAAKQGAANTAHAPSDLSPRPGFFALPCGASGDLRQAVSRATELQLLEPAPAAPLADQPTANAAPGGDLLAAAAAYASGGAGGAGGVGPSLSGAWAAVTAAEIAVKAADLSTGAES